MHALDAPVRLAGLAATGLMDAPPSPTLDRFARIAAAALGVPVALVSLVDGARQFFTSQVGLPEPLASERQTPLTHSFCRHVVATEAPLVVEDARLHPLVQSNPAVRDLSVLAYAGMPIGLPTGEILGSFCAIDMVPRQWTERELGILRGLADAVSDELELRRHAHAAAASERNLHDLLGSVEKARSDRSAAVRKVQHDIRSPLGVIAMSAEMLLEHDAIAQFPEVKNALETILQNTERVNAISKDFASS